LHDVAFIEEEVGRRKQKELIEFAREISSDRWTDKGGNLGRHTGRKCGDSLLEAKKARREIVSI